MPDRVFPSLVAALVFLLAFALPLAWGQSSSPNFAQPASRTGGGGGASSSSSYAVDAATGQATAGPATSSSFRKGSGFIYTIDPENQPLPVELASFEAVRAGESSVDLTWTTLSEQQNAGFRVEHLCCEKGTWQKIAFVESKATGGTTSEAKTYRFTAEDMRVGTHKFRLRQVDHDGTTHVHEPVTIGLQMQEALRLSAPAPNPVRGQANLSFAVKEPVETTITLYNMLGQQVRTVYEGVPSAGETQSAQLDVSSLSSGAYFLRLRAGSQTRTEQVMIVR